MLVPSYSDKPEGIVFSRTEKRALASPAQRDVSNRVTTSLLPGVTMSKIANWMPQDFVSFLTLYPDTTYLQNILGQKRAGANSDLSEALWEVFALQTNFELESNSFLFPFKFPLIYLGTFFCDIFINFT